MSAVEDMMRSSNPVPSPLETLTDDDMNALLLLTITRSNEMEDKGTPTTTEDRGSPRGWGIAVAAFAVVILVVGAILLIPRGDDPAPVDEPVATTTSAPEAAEDGTPIEVEPENPAAQGPVITEEMQTFLDNYPDAYNSGDPETLRDAYVVGASRAYKDSPELLISVDQIVEEMVHLRARETTLALENCTPSATSITCDTVLSGPYETAVFDGPIVARDTYTVDPDGRVVRVAVSAPQVDMNTQVAFERWLEAEHPDVYAQLLDLPFRQFLAYDDSEIYLEWAPVWADLGRP